MSRLPYLFLTASLLGVGAAGCVQEEPAAEYGDPTRQDLVTTSADISAQVVVPDAPSDVGTNPVTVSVRAWIEGEDATLDVSIGPAEGYGRRAVADGDIFSADVPLVHGINDIKVTISDRNSSRRRTVPLTLRYTGDAPGFVVDMLALPGPGGTCGERLEYAVTGADELCVGGRVSSAAGASVSSLAVTGDSNTEVSVGDSGTFVATLPLVGNSDNEFTFAVTDSARRTASGAVEVRQDATPPVLTLTSPQEDGVSTTANSYTLEGTATDDVELVVLRFEGADGGFSDIDFMPGGWEFPLQLVTGENRFNVIAEDRAGNVTSVERVINRERVHSLSPPPEERSVTTLRLSRDALEQLLDEDAQKELTLVEIPIAPFLEEAIAAIRNPFESGTDTSDWGPPQYNFFRLLNLSVDTADLDGTSLEDMSNLAYAIGLPTERVLADVLDVEVDEPALTTELVVQVLAENLVGTHPNAEFNEAGEAVLRIRLFDALNDLEPLAERFGPVPDIGHPGIIAGAISSVVFEPGFLMSVRATTNLIEYQGVDASRASKSYIFVPRGDSVLELDVYDDETFSVVGLVDEPVVDLSIAVNESPTYHNAGTSRGTRPDPTRSGFFYGDSSVWDLDPWVLERIVADTVYRRFVDNYADSNYLASYVYSAGSIDNAAELSWDRGWFVTDTAGGLGNPPDPQYVWDALTELAQERLHDGGLNEGEANAEFALTDVPVGLNSDDLVDALRPALDEQQERLSELLLGANGVSISDADFYLASTGSAAVLYFRSSSDNAGPYEYARPGFFADAALTDKVSTTAALPGASDTEHEKVVIEGGDTLYFEDNEGAVYRVEVVAAGADVQLRTVEVTE